MKDFAIKGNIIWSASADRLELRENAWAVCVGGLCAGVFDELPERYAGLPKADYGDKLIIPGYYDLHLHAAQYDNCGLGMDYELLDWLQELTYPHEASFKDLSFAQKAYGRFTDDLLHSATVRASIFASAHTGATLLLMEMLEKAGLAGYVGRVNMDRDAPDYIREPTPEQALRDTEDWLSRCGGFTQVHPILTPRFVPSCTDALLAGLGKLAEKYLLPVQSHLSENFGEIELVRVLHPASRDYTDVYDKFGLLPAGTLMAHCVHLTEGEMAVLRDRGVYVVHCPTSNTNVRSGMAPIRKYMEYGLSIGLGSDVSGGHTLDMAQVLRHAIEVSKLLWRERGTHDYLRSHEAFYLATRGGGSWFGKAGAFDEGFVFDAVVIDDSRAGRDARSLRARFEQMIYRAEYCVVAAKYVGGRRLF